MWVRRDPRCRRLNRRAGGGARREVPGGEWLVGMYLTTTVTSLILTYGTCVFIKEYAGVSLRNVSLEGSVASIQR